MTLVLDSGGLSALAGDQARLAELRRRGLWPAQVPSAVLVEALTAYHHRDVDAIVAAHAARCPDPVVLTSDPAGLTALAANAPTRLAVARA
jgi:hypothetical protein